MVLTCCVAPVENVAQIFPRERNCVPFAPRTSSSSRSKFSTNPPSAVSWETPTASTSLPVSGIQLRETGWSSVANVVATGTVAVLDADVMLSFNCPTRLVDAFLVERCWGHSDWKCPTCLHPLHRFPAAGHAEVGAQLGHLDGAWSVFCGEATAFDCDFCRLYVDLTTWTPRGEDMPSSVCLAASSARQMRIAPSKVRSACPKSLCRVSSSSTPMTTLSRKMSSLTFCSAFGQSAHILGLQVWHTDMSKNRWRETIHAKKWKMNQTILVAAAPCCRSRFDPRESFSDDGHKPSPRRSRQGQQRWSELRWSLDGCTVECPRRTTDGPRWLASPCLGLPNAGIWRSLSMPPPRTRNLPGWQTTTAWGAPLTQLECLGTTSPALVANDRQRTAWERTQAYWPFAFPALRQPSSVFSSTQLVKRRPTLGTGCQGPLEAKTGSRPVPSAKPCPPWSRPFPIHTNSASFRGERTDKTKQKKPSYVHCAMLCLKNLTPYRRHV